MAWKAELKKYIPHNTAIKMNENTPRTKSALPLMTVLFKISQKKDEPKSCRFPFNPLMALVLIIQRQCVSKSADT